MGDFINQQNYQNLGTFNEQIYGYKHGIRPLVLQTQGLDKKDIIETRLNKTNIDYFSQKTPYGNNINFFFGDKPCVDVIKSFGKKPLYEYSPEQDFILGVLLGYDKTKQCERFLKLKEKEDSKNLDIVA